MHAAGGASAIRRARSAAERRSGGGGGGGGGTEGGGLDAKWWDWGTEDAQQKKGWSMSAAQQMLRLGLGSGLKG